MSKAVTYSTCLHCQRSLGHNEAIEAFPVGQRIAFDADKGRLWVVCRRCARWNLAPLEERWEALEEAERAFRSTRVRVSTDNIGLARLRDGTELVRVGRPLRPEFAAWRYGDQFGRRRRKAIVAGVAATGAVGLASYGLVAASAGIVVLLPILQLVNFSLLAATHGMDNKPVANPAGGYFRYVGRPKLTHRPDVSEGWGIEVGVTQFYDEWPTWKDTIRQKNMEIARLNIRGNDAAPLLRRTLPRVNRGGASRSLIQDSIRLIEEAGDPARFGEWAAARRREWGAKQAFGDTGDIGQIPPAARLAFEMAIFEEDERRVMLGELASLEAAWIEAERIAKIADNLLTPPRVDERLQEMKDRQRDS